MKTTSQGITLAELLIVLAVAGVLTALVGTQINLAGAATQQAAQVVASAMNQARFEAIRTNNTAGFVVIGSNGTTSGRVEVCRNVDESVALSCATGEVFQIVDFSDGDLARAMITAPANTTVFIDRRGIVRNPSSGGHNITIVDRSGANVRTVTILPTGRVEVN